MDVKVGDIVHVRMRVDCKHDDGTFRVIIEDDDDAWVGWVGWASPRSIVHVEPAPLPPLKKGDKLWWKLAEIELTVIAADEGRVWAKWSDGNGAFIDASFVESEYERR